MQYLLERLAHAGADPASRAQAFDLRAAVRDQVERLVSSHFWPGAPGLQLMGMNLPPVAGYGYAVQDDVASYAAGIRDLIVRSEPRLQGARVSVVRAGGALMPYRVQVTGRLADGGDADTFEFSLPLRGQG